MVESIVGNIATFVFAAGLILVIFAWVPIEFKIGGSTVRAPTTLGRRVACMSIGLLAIAASLLYGRDLALPASLWNVAQDLNIEVNGLRIEPGDCVFDVEQKAIACGFTFFANIGDARVSLLRDTRIFDAAGISYEISRVNLGGRDFQVGVSGPVGTAKIAKGIGVRVILVFDNIQGEAPVIQTLDLSVLADIGGDEERFEIRIGNNDLQSL